MESKDFVVTYSQLLDFRKCRLMWDLTYRQQYVPKQEKDYFAFGRALHYGLNCYYTNNGDFIQAVDGFDEVWSQYRKRVQDTSPISEMEMDAISQSRELALHMLAEYDYLAKRVDDFEVVALEKVIIKPLPTFSENTPFYLKGTVDGVVKDKRGLYWLLEFKTSKDMSDNWIELDEQATVYQWLAEQEYGVKIHGTYYTIMRKKIPEEPKVLKDGKLSKDKSQSTSPRQVLSYIESLEQLPDYTDFMAVMANKFIKRIAIHRNAYEIVNTIDRICLVVEDMINPRVYASPDWNNCYWGCSFYRYCLALQDGSDTEDVLRTSFRKGNITW